MRLIIADGQEVYREGVKSLLADCDWVEVVGEADDGAALLKLMESVTADVALVDIGISDGPSLQVVEGLREVAPEVRVVIVTVADDHVREAIELGVDAYLLKSAAAHELTAALRLVADGHHYIQAELVNTLRDPSAALSDRLWHRRSPQQQRILQLVTQGMKNKQIARQLGISETTVKSQLRVIYSHLEASSRVEAVAAALRLGIVE
jgi:DNA-binding NarL/FixJ family response regulator